MSWVITGSEKVAQDPYLYTNTVLLLKGDGTNGSTTILDSSKVAGSPKTVTAVGNAQISTAQSKFGGSSIAFDGTGDYLTLDGSAAFLFGTGDFTIEAWFRPSNLTGLKIIVDARPQGTSGVASHWVIATDGATINYAVAGSSYAGGALSLNTWHFLALSRASGSTRAFLDGVQIGSTITDTTNYLIGASRPIIGADGNSPTALNFTGYIDDLRITKGVARYTANFTPPTTPFPDI
jgi:hypothetical protein